VIIHGPTPQRDFTIISNDVIRDAELSYRARGLLVFLLSQPPDWETSSARLALEGGEGRDAIRTALRELVNAGYLQLAKEQNSRGYWQAQWVVVATPWAFPEPVDNPVDKSATGA